MADGPFASFVSPARSKFRFDRTTYGQNETAGALYRDCYRMALSVAVACGDATDILAARPPRCTATHCRCTVQLIKTKRTSSTHFHHTLPLRRHQPWVGCSFPCLLCSIMGCRFRVPHQSRFTSAMRASKSTAPLLANTKPWCGSGSTHREQRGALLCHCLI